MKLIAITYGSKLIKMRKKLYKLKFFSINTFLRISSYKYNCCCLHLIFSCKIYKYNKVLYLILHVLNFYFFLLFFYDVLCLECISGFMNTKYISNYCNLLDRMKKEIPRNKNSIFPQ